MTANVLDISHLTLSIEHKTILQDIDLTIGAGETVALIGESGSGKSTLAQCILGLQPQRSRLAPESRIDFLGEPLPIENDARMRRWRGCSISMIFQDPMSCLNPYLRVGTQILEALKRGSASDEDPHARVLELLEMVDLPEPKQTAGKYPYELSGGQQQRIMIAMALANRPQLLIADEPTSSLDACVQAEILKLLERLQKAFSLSMLFITHNMAAERVLAHLVYVRQHGRIAES
ncbi:dipeptide/oligopeptide/nickel ABC transporter ATP-binding protein, partial [Sutterella wadsworthensis]|uniref:dipeptide/oligopeptide/nickel ABC transporter ATP-binding protein n=1 Tax=Sutterella wadsworthensis TaxID=40545 RepID=UPI00307799D4